MRTLCLLICLPMLFVLGCQPAPRADDATKQLLPHEMAALQRMNERLTSDAMVGGGPLTHAQIHQVRDQWLAGVDAPKWLGAPGMAQLQSPSWDDQWKQAMTGQDTGIIVDTVESIQKAQAAQDAPGLDERQAVRQLLGARADALDAHTHYVPAAQQQEHNDRALRRRVGVGVVLTWRPDQPVVVESITPEAGEAVRTLIQAGDRLVAVYRENEWHLTATQTPLEVTAWLRGKTGSVVRLRLEREGLEFEVQATRVRQALNDERLKVHQENATYQGKTWTWLRLELKFFYESGTDEEGNPIAGVAQDVEEALKQAGEVDGVVVDLRRCRGGAIEQALALTGLFTSGGPVVSLHNGNRLLTTLNAPERARAWSSPVQIWVGPNTASSAEALGLALHDRIDAPLVGWPTYGKGTLQRRMELDMQSIRKREPSRVGELWWTFGVLAGPNGDRWQQQGLPLDLALPNPVEEPWGERAASRALRAKPHQHTSHLLPDASAEDAKRWSQLHATNEDGEEFVAWERVGAWVWAHRKAREGGQ